MVISFLMQRSLMRSANLIPSAGKKEHESADFLVKEIKKNIYCSWLCCFIYTVLTISLHYHQGAENRSERTGGQQRNQEEGGAVSKTLRHRKESLGLVTDREYTFDRQQVLQL